MITPEARAAHGDHDLDAKQRGAGARRRDEAPFRVRVIALLIAAVTIVAAAIVYYRVSDARSVEWGVTFSQKASRDFRLDWRANYLAVIDDLKPSGLRLVAYWDLVEPKRGQYDFRDLDWQMAEAEKAHIPVVLAVGQKVPRWPEYHFPKWLDANDTHERQARLLAYLAKISEHYRDSKVLVYWQVENEPFVAFGKGPKKFDPDFLAREVAVVRGTDPHHEILETDGGEWGKWYPSAKLGDAFGTTLYRRVYSKAIGSFCPSRTPDYYRLKADATRLIAGKPDQKVICIELQAEPWGHTLNPRMTVDQQVDYFPPSAFDENVDFARKTGLKTFYLWGAEWWYFLQQHGKPVYWDRARELIRSGRH